MKIELKQDNNIFSVEGEPKENIFNYIKKLIEKSKFEIDFVDLKIKEEYENFIND